MVLAALTSIVWGFAFVAVKVGLDSFSAPQLTAVRFRIAGLPANVLVKRAPGVAMFPLVIWCSLVPPVPALIVSGVLDQGVPLVEAVRQASWLGIGAAVYLGALATVVAYAAWGHLLQRYPTAVVAPFALLAPCTGVLASALILGEAFSPVRYAGMALILGGLAVIVLPASRPPRLYRGFRAVTIGWL
jgi:O-acetylserine/cysteine efflux transporter